MCQPRFDNSPVQLKYKFITNYIMKRILACLMALFLFAGSMFAKDNEAKINVMSYNIRYDNPGDGDNQWKMRKDYAADLVKFYSVDVYGAQEVLNNQLNDMIDRLPGFDYVGVGRADGKTEGEYSPIIYRKDRLVVEKSGNFWLAEDKNAVGKKGWDAACERVATWAIFKDKLTGKRFFMLNTHLDHMGKVARHEGAALVLEETKRLSAGLPVIVTGDFNATPDDDPILVLTDKNDPRHLIHSRDIAELKYGPDWSFHDFGRVPLDKRSFIDYIFVKGNVKVYRHGVLSESKGNLYPSDHCPILTTMSF